uniref:Small ribosomal subunit protein uS3c n=1 Tax=Lepocinclis tripteris TaxID=135494 RepID=A0A3G3LKY1_9EUGL|nr:ribosomal protein S3 [Lepocinclis tripteris]AYQ93375.1 ribosomal protein S3 [Lepocinclis tripteris]
MGQKIHPHGFRLGIYKKHSAFWYADRNTYSKILKQDIFIRNYLKEKINTCFLVSIIINRKLDSIDLTVNIVKNTSKFNNELFEQFIRELSVLLKNKFNVELRSFNFVEVLNPDTCASFVADSIKLQLEKRLPFRKIMKDAVVKSIKAGSKGIKIQISGRLNGAEIARSEWIREGRVPLHTLNANIDYCNSRAQTIFGVLGIKVWLYNE